MVCLDYRLVEGVLWHVTDCVCLWLNSGKLLLDICNENDVNRCCLIDLCFSNLSFAFFTAFHLLSPHPSHTHTHAVVSQPGRCVACRVKVGATCDGCGGWCGYLEGGGETEDG